MKQKYIDKYLDHIANMTDDEKKESDKYLAEFAKGEIQGPHVDYPEIDKIWLKYYNDTYFELPNKTVYEYVLENNRNNLDNVALEFFGTKITYREFFKNVKAAEKSFVKMGIKKGDVVSFCVPTLPETFYAFYALNKIGAIANMIDPRTNVSSIKNFIENANSKMIIYIDIAHPKMASIINDLNINKVVKLSVSDSFPKGLKIMYKMKNIFNKNKKIEVNKKIINWNDFIKNGQNYHIDKKMINTDDKLNIPAGIVYTSGTTGIPKGSVMNNRNFLSMVYQNHAANMGWDKNDILLGIMPPFIAYGLVCGFVLPLCNGMQIDIIPKFEKDKFDEYILKHRPNHIMGVPSYLDELADSEKFDGEDLSFIKTAIVGGDKLVISSEEKINRFLEEHGSMAKVSKGYGMTEMSSNAVYTTCDETNKVGSVGIPLLGNGFKIVDEKGNSLPYGEIGEVCMNGPTLIEGYLNNPAENQKVFKIENSSRWVHTGDNAYMDRDGLVYFQDRSKRIIIRSDGHNVWPSRIEQIIEENPNVKMCCVTGIKEKKGNGAIPTAFIVLKDGTLEKAEEIIKAINDESLKRLPERDIALEYIIKEELPLTPVGKIDYRKLSEEDVDSVKIKKIVLNR